MDETLRLTTPTPTPVRMVPRVPPRCWDCQWLDYMLDTTGERVYETRMLDHINATHARAGR